MGMCLCSADLSCLSVHPLLLIWSGSVHLGNLANKQISLLFGYTPLKKVWEATLENASDTLGWQATRVVGKLENLTH